MADPLDLIQSRALALSKLTDVDLGRVFSGGYGHVKRMHALADLRSILDAIDEYGRVKRPFWTVPK